MTCKDCILTLIVSDLVKAHSVSRYLYLTSAVRVHIKVAQLAKSSVMSSTNSELGCTNVVTCTALYILQETAYIMDCVTSQLLCKNFT
jgi:hypothetical protein